MPIDHELERMLVERRVLLNNSIDFDDMYVAVTRHLITKALRGNRDAAFYLIDADINDPSTPAVERIQLIKLKASLQTQ